MAHFDPSVILAGEDETEQIFTPPADEHPENSTDVPASAGSDTEEPDTAPVKNARPVAPAKAKRGRSAPKSKSESCKALHIRVQEHEHTELKVACIYGKTNLNDFVRNAFMDALKRTYECVDADCGYRFTTRVTDGREPPKAIMCPICGKKVSAVRY